MPLYRTTAQKSTTHKKSPAPTDTREPSIFNKGSTASIAFVDKLLADPDIATESDRPSITDKPHINTAAQLRDFIDARLALAMMIATANLQPGYDAGILGTSYRQALFAFVRINGNTGTLSTLPANADPLAGLHELREWAAGRVGNARDFSKLSETERAIANYITAHPGSMGSAIARAVDVSDVHFRRIVRRLKAAGFTNRRGAGYFPPT